MIILDTNVVSEPMKLSGSPAVQAWLDRQAPQNLYLTATSLAELLVGIEILHDGKRKRQLAAALIALMDKLFGARILPFDQAAAVTYASLITRARVAGRVMSFADGQIAAIAVSRHFAVATRDTAPFASVGLAVTNPWTA
ncbi:type II toxin-antitoxin system VapC family toxin [Duganella sp. HH101]|uniref:type II toxin-antitoxin system VapC family toxin n=1 Tax=Duganella sp. HH101 TaxID=1781066 RepID=UPI00087477FF|nr:type II toxin-antitoxin system VapC family toxin [Duganella sp. HH101]